MIDSLRLAPMRPLDPSLFPEVFRKTTPGAFDETAKRARREKQFPADLRACFEMGAELGS